MRGTRALAVAALVMGGAVAGCGSSPPEDVAGYENRCVRMNAQPLGPRKDDPHEGNKNVYACNVAEDVVAANTRPFPEGTLIIKESFRTGEDFVWLLALARKQDGVWRWDEYTRNFADEEFRHVLAGQSVCTGCHDQARSIDWIFTTYRR